MSYKLNLLINTDLRQAVKAIPTDVTSLDLSWNCLGLSNGIELAQIFAAIPENITSLDLSQNSFNELSGVEFAQAFAAIPANVISLDLRSTYLSYLPWALLKNSLPHIQSVYLDVSEIKTMSKEQCHMCRSAFPNIQKIILVDDNDKEVDIAQSIEMSNYVRELGGKTEVPSLLHQCSSFFKKHQMEINDKNVPQELKEFVSSCG